MYVFQITLVVVVYAFFHRDQLRAVLSDLPGLLTFTGNLPIGGISPAAFHSWTLATEEQFYLLWPAFLLVAMRLSRPRLSAAVLLLVIQVTSLVGAIVLTSISPPWAFYSLPTRAWQLALGGLLALVAFSVTGLVCAFRSSSRTPRTVCCCGRIAISAR